MNRLLLPLVLGTALFHGEAYSAGHLWSQTLPDYSQGYDEQRDPARDLAAATAKASAEGKKVLLLVGGEWCSWCQEMNHFLDQNPDLASQLNRTFVVVKVNVSKQNKNESFLKGYPEYLGCPTSTCWMPRASCWNPSTPGCWRRVTATTGRNSASSSPSSSPRPPTADSPIDAIRAQHGR